jgi:GATA-binding protein
VALAALSSSIPSSLSGIGCHAQGYVSLRSPGSRCLGTLFPAPFIPQDCEPSHGPYPRPDTTLYGEPLPLIDNSPQLISFGQDNHSFHPGHYDMSVSSSPASSYVEFENLDHNVKLEESAPVIVPSQTCLYRPPSSGAMHAMSYLPPHTGLPVQHTDDAASKETQYLRRRCFNCSQTEPPSWRRSTLNPGKIVCNKCGLYERTHLRPRPLRFDELRTGSKSRKQSKSISGSPASKLIKKEVESQAMSRRASVSSSSSSVHSSSDWDDSGSTMPFILSLIIVLTCFTVSVYSSGSASTSSFNSPAVTSFSLPLERSSQSPPLGARDGGIRLPNAPLSDIASLQSVPASPRKAANIT